MPEWLLVLLIVLGALVVANVAPPPLGFMRTTREGNRYLRDVLGEDDDPA